MEATLKFIQTIRFFMAGSIVVYAMLVWWLPSSATPNPTIFRAITGMAFLLVLLIFVMRKIYVLPAERTLAMQPQDKKALGRWRQGYLVVYVLSEAIALYGLALHFLGSQVSQIAAFFLSGFVLILFFRPKMIENGTFPSQQGPTMPR